MTALLWGVFVLLLLQAIFVVWNLRGLRKLRHSGSDAVPLPRTHAVELSIVIPARNEERNIEHCLRSVLAAMEGTDRTVEVLVLDDGSTDVTAAIVSRLALQHRSIRLIPGEEKPAGWTGKNFACHQLAHQAKGKWLLYLDADARLVPGSLSRVFAEMNQPDADMVTGFPKQVTRSWMEMLVVPMMMFTVACHLPIRLVSRSSNPKFTAAHGGFILVRSESYHRIGGHQHIAAAIVDDMELAKRMKRSGGAVKLVDVTDVVEMRMYSNAREVWAGYRKNIYYGLGRNGYLLLFVSAWYGILYIMPVLTLLFSELYQEWLLPSLLCCTAGVVIKAFIDIHQRTSKLACCLLPASIGIVLAIGYASWFASYGKRGYEWKGRRYP